MYINSKECTLIRKTSVQFEVVGGARMVRDGKSMAAMGQAHFVAVLAEGARGTMIALVVAEDAVGASRVELRKKS
jgi:hypothetical protein